MRVVSGCDTVLTVKVLVPATMHSKFVFNEQRPTPDRVREEACGKLEAIVSLVTVIVDLL
jgi:hypothetical protein